VYTLIEYEIKYLMKKVTHSKSPRRVELLENWAKMEDYNLANDQSPLLKRLSLWTYFLYHLMQVDPSFSKFLPNYLEQLKIMMLKESYYTC